MSERRDERGEGSPEERAARLFPVPHSDITDAEVVKSIAAAIRDAEAAMKERAAQVIDKEADALRWPHDATCKRLAESIRSL